MFGGRCDGKVERKQRKSSIYYISGFRMWNCENYGVWENELHLEQHGYLILCFNEKT